MWMRVHNQRPKMSCRQHPLVPTSQIPGLEEKEETCAEGVNAVDNVNSVSAEQQQFLSQLVMKMVQAEKLQVDVDGAQVENKQVPAEQISRNQQQTSSKSKRRRLA